MGKRTAEVELSKDNSDSFVNQEAGTFKRASAEELAKRKIVRAGQRKSKTVTAPAAAALPKFSFGTPKFSFDDIASSSSPQKVEPAKTEPSPPPPTDKPAPSTPKDPTTTTTTTADATKPDKSSTPAKSELTFGSSNVFDINFGSATGPSDSSEKKTTDLFSSDTKFSFEKATFNFDAPIASSGKLGEGGNFEIPGQAGQPAKDFETIFKDGQAEATGEEEDECIHQEGDVKLFEWSDEAKQFSGRGRGVLNINRVKVGDGFKHRIVIRNEKTKKLLLNMVLLPFMTFDAAQNNKFIQFLGNAGSGWKQYCLKPSAPERTEALKAVLDKAKGGKS